MIIDSHSHLFLDDFKNDIEQVIERAKANSIDKIITVGFSLKTSEDAYNLNKKDDMFLNTAGIHPSEVSDDFESDIKEFQEFLETKHVYAIGEIGLDFYWKPYDEEKQKKYFIAQLDLAKKYRLPVIIHMRDATKATYDILSQYKGLKGVMHCYSGSYEMALQFIKLGFYISLAGPVTYKNSVESKKIAKEIPLNKMLVETDSPYLPPIPYRGKRNESSYIVNIIKAIAELREISFDEVAEATYKNASALFDI